MLHRSNIFPEEELPCSADIVGEGIKYAKDWHIGHSEFLVANGVSCESEFKKSSIATGTIMQHAQVGYRSKEKSCEAFFQIYDQCLQKGVQVDRYGICLDWSMGFPSDIRDKQMQGTGLILNDTEDFVALSNSAPVASHYGDFVLGFPAALENTQNALTAGSTSIGNLGQYFTFKLPDWNDDVVATESTLCALSLIAAQPVDVLVHSNLDDGFAAVFEDLSCALGAVLLEIYIVEELIGAKISHCYGHHYSTPLVRYAFQKALRKVSNQPGTMVYGNTVAYQGTDAENYASLSGYLLVDIMAQRNNPSGHGINPVPVTENKRIPDVQEIIDAQLFANRLRQQSSEFISLVDETSADRMVEQLIQGAQAFKDNLLHGFENGGIDITNPFEMLLAIRRIGGKTLESLYGPGPVIESQNKSKTQDSHLSKRHAIVLSDTIRSIHQAIDANVEVLKNHGATDIQRNLKLVVATTDVHEHGKMLIEGIFTKIGIHVIDGGVSAYPVNLVKIAEEHDADAIALSTYNGVALTYYGQLKDNLTELGLNIPVLIGGRLNEIPEETENSLPKDVIPELEEQGAIVCRQISDAMPCLIALSQSKNINKNR